MDSRYKIIVSNKNIYREIELAPNAKAVKLGTGVGCDIRLRKDLFFGQIELNFVKNEKGWSVLCSDNLYITAGDVRKLMTASLRHGDIFFVKYQESDNDVFSVEFLIDFDDGKKKYERAVDLSAVQSFSISSPSGGANIVLASPYVKEDLLELTRKGTSLFVSVKKTTYGFYHNGKKCSAAEEVKDGDFFSISDYSFYYKNNFLWTEIRSDMAIKGLTYQDYRMNPAYPKFNRNTRVQTVVNDEKIEILDPPAKPQKPKNNWLTRLLPSLGMLVASGVMAFFGGAMIIFSAISGVMAIVTTIIMMREGNKDFETQSADRIEKYNAYIDKKRAEIQTLRAEERNTLEELFISPEVEQERFGTFSSDLFDRNKEDDDFLCVRLGCGDVEAKREVNYKKQEKLEIEDDLQLLPERICEEFKNVHNAPIVCNLKEHNAVGVIGSLANRFNLLKNIVIDLSARQYFTDVKMVFVAEEKNKASMHWFRLLPHLYNDSLGIRNIVCDDESKNIIFEYLYKELTNREQNKSYDSNIVAFFFDEYGFKSHPISKFVDKAKDLGITFVFFGNTRAEIPMGCDSIIDIRDEQNAVLVDTHDKDKSLNFVYPKISNEKAANIVNLLAPVYTEEISLESTLTKNISLFELLNIIAVDDIDLASRWSESQVFKSMSAPIGVSKSGIISLDLHDKAHGPHGLVAGTTGSGKSEILQTYILAMSTLFHPHEVAFVIIDFKGGGMVNQFKELPHLLGAITNIDGKEIDRSLKSIKAELQKRQRLFADADVNHIDKYIKKYKAGEVATPLPHLIIIVDEFAELKAEQPEFMKELISAARIGRSLGVHLILATQKPSGQVNEQIWSNSRFKLCLKVQSQEDSNEVLKSPLAAEIKEPGRAYLQVGNNEIFELFQSAYSGAPEKVDDSKIKEFSIFGLNESGRRIPVYSQKKQKGGEGSATQLDAIVKYVNGYCQATGIEHLPNICLPPLKERIAFPKTENLLPKSNDIVVELGTYDDPDNQYQGTYSVNLTNDNLIIIGSSQSGKTNLLQNIIRSVSTKYSPDEVNMYIIDFASMVLKNFESLNHVGGVVTSSEDEKLKNLMKLLFSEIETRKEKLLSVGVSSFSAYKEAGKTDLPQIILMIDNLTALKELYFQDDDDLLTLCREGTTVGISIVIANAQTAGIGYKYLSNFSSRIAMFCNDSSEYSSLFDHCSERVNPIAGRCLVEEDKNHLDCQMYLAFEGEKEIDRVEKIRSYIEETNAQNNHMFARKIPVIPDVLSESMMCETYKCENNKNTFVVGLDYATVSPAFIDYVNQGVLCLTGTNIKNKARFLKYLLRALVNIDSELFILDDYNEIFSSFASSPCMELYSRSIEDVKEMVQSFADKVIDRNAKREIGGKSAVDEMKPLVFVVNNSEALRAISEDARCLENFKNILKKYTGLKALFVFADVKNEAIPYSSPEALRLLKDANQWLVFENIANVKVFDCPISLVKKWKAALADGELFFMSDNYIRKIKSVSME